MEITSNTEYTFNAIWQNSIIKNSYHLVARAGELFNSVLMNMALLIS